MDFLVQLLHYIRHLDVYVNDLATWNLPAFYAILFAVIFAETGLVVTPFLPGDSLLFAIGSVAAMQGSSLSMPLLIILLIVAAVLGDAVNYSIGYRMGPAVFRYENSWLLNKNHLIKAQNFYLKYGSKTIILARFVPIVRTFAPFVAGIGKMNYSKFGFYNVLGGVLWVVSCICAGYYFGNIPWVKDRFEIVVLAIILLSILPMVFEFYLEMRRHARAKKQASGKPDVAHEAA